MESWDGMTVRVRGWYYESLVIEIDNAPNNNAILY